MKPRARLLARLLVALCTGTIVAACDGSDDPVAGGSAVEGETVTARILDARGVPVARTTVRATVDDPADWSGTAVTDDSGRISIQVPPTAELLVLVLESPDLPGRFLTFRIPLRPSLDTSLVLERWGRLSGTVLAPSGWSPRTVLVPGLDLRSTVTDARFAFLHVPPGDWPLRLSADSAGTIDTFELGWARMPAGGGDLQQTFSVREDGVFASSFDDTASSSLPVCSGGAAASASCAQSVTGSGAWSGSSLRAHLAGATGSAASVRVPAGIDSSSPLAAKALDTLVLMARGTGLVNVALGIASGDSTILSAPYAILLKPTWTGYRTPLSALLPKGADLVGVRWIAFLSEEDSWLVLDDLALFPER